MIRSATSIRSAVAKKVGLIPAVGYLRVSTRKQDKSTKDQRAEIVPYAAAHGYTVVRWHTDEGISGDGGLKREAFFELLEDARTSADFEVILVWDQDRFSRADKLETNHYWYLFRQAGKRIEAVRQGPLDWDSMGGMLQADIEQYANHDYLHKLAGNVTRARKQKALDGQWNARPPFGYEIDPDSGRLVPMNDQAEWVRRIFHDYTRGGLSMRAIARGMQAAKILTKNKRTDWNAEGIHGILKNVAYCGTVDYGNVQKGRYARLLSGEITSVHRTERDRVGRQANAADRIIVAAAHPAIIDDATFRRAQEKLGRNARPEHGEPIKGRAGSRRHTKSYPLTGLAHCGHCGRQIGGSSLVRGDYVRNRYVCIGRNRPGGVEHAECRFYLVAEDLHELIFADLDERFLSDEKIEAFRQDIIDYVRRARKDFKTDTAALLAKIQKAEKAVAQAERRLLITPDDLYATVCSQVREIRGDRDRFMAELTAQKQIAALTGAAVDGEADRVAKQLKRLRLDLAAGDWLTTHEALAKIIDRITIFGRPGHDADWGRDRVFLDRIEIRYRTDISYTLSGSSSIKRHRVNDKAVVIQR